MQVPGALAAGWTHVVPRPLPGLFDRAARALGAAQAVEPAPLEPRGVGALLDTALDVLRARFLACFGLTCAVLLPLSLLARALRRVNDDTLATLFFDGAATFVAQAVAIGLLTHLVYEQMQGRRVSALESLAAAARRGPALLGLALVTQLGTALGICCLIVPGLAVAWLSAVAPAALVLEGAGPIAALSRSSALMRTALPRWAGVMALQILLVLPLTLSVAALEEYGARAAGDAGAGFVVLETIAHVALTGLATCLAAVVLTVLYIDGRVRAEGFDLSMRFERLSAARGGRP